MLSVFIRNIMVIDLKKLRESGKTENAFHFEYSPERELTDIPGASLKLPVSVTGTVTLTDKHSAYLEGEVIFGIFGDCTRCLSQTERLFAVEFSEHVSENDEESYPVINDKVDLAAIVDDVIVMNQPVSFLCKDDCKGICPGCGVNLNREECKCK